MTGGGEKAPKLLITHPIKALAKEGKLNKRGIMAFRKSVDGLLTGAEICALREKYKLTQSHAAKLFGGGPVAFSKYENDDVAQSEAMDNLLRLVRRSETAFLELVDEKGMRAELGIAQVAEPTHMTVTTNVVVMAQYREEVAYRTVQKTTVSYAPEEGKVWK